MSKRQFQDVARCLTLGNMWEPDARGRVIDLAEYRARRNAQRSRAQVPRYMLWYPGFGCFGPDTLASVRAAADWWSAAGRRERRP